MKNGRPQALFCIGNVPAAAMKFQASRRRAREESVMRFFTDTECEIAKNRLARAIGTVKRFVTLLDVVPLDDRVCHIRARHRGGYVYVFRFDKCRMQVLEVWREVGRENV